MNKRVIVIGAVSQNGVYGEGSKIPWHISSEYKHFQARTFGYTVVMGRGTWESLPGKFRPLPGRVNFVVTNTPDYQAKGMKVFASVQQAVEAAPTEKVFCIGGAQVWYEAMYIAHEAYISVIKRDYPVTKRVTFLAPELLRPQERWEDFMLLDSEKSEDLEGYKLTDPPYEIYHWVKQ